MTKVFDSTPIMANELLASSLHGMLTNPSLKWFSLTLGEHTELLQRLEVKQYLSDVRDIMFSAINNPKAGFTNAMHEFYLEYTAFGTGPFFVGESKKLDSLVFSAKPLSQVLLAEDSDGRVDTFFREFKFTVRQIMEKWGKENVSSETIEKAKAGKMDEETTIIHVVQPRTELNRSKKDSQNLPIQSLFIEKKAKHTLSDRGFAEQPMFAPRFNKAPNEVYGRSPSTTALPDVKMLNRMMETTIRSAQKVVDPPLLVSDDGAIGPVRTVPGGINYLRDGADIRPLNTGGQVQLADALMESIRLRIREAYFLNQLQLNQGPQMTATEVLQRTEESLRVLGPALGRLQTELLGPMIDRIFGLLSRAGKLPEAPVDIQDLELEVIYESPIARAQKTIETQGVLRTIEAMGPLIQADPSIMDNFDGDKTFGSFSFIMGVNPNNLRSPEAVAKMRQERQKAIQDQQDAELAKTSTEAALNATEMTRAN